MRPRDPRAGAAAAAAALVREARRSPANGALSGSSRRPNAACPAITDPAGVVPAPCDAASSAESPREAARAWARAVRPPRTARGRPQTIQTQTAAARPRGCHRAFPCQRRRVTAPTGTSQRRPGRRGSPPPPAAGWGQSVPASRRWTSWKTRCAAATATDQGGERTPPRGGARLCLLRSCPASP